MSPGGTSLGIVVVVAASLLSVGAGAVVLVTGAVVGAVTVVGGTCD
jgi:hypothetical protein